MYTLPEPVYWTPQMVRELPDDGNRYETIHGELLVTPASPRVRHQWVVGELLVLLHTYCKATGVGDALCSPSDITLTKDSLVQPDVFVVPPIRDVDGEWRDIGRPLLVVEVLSRSTARRDRFVKRVHYQHAGIPYYWIVDPKHRLVEVWVPDADAPVVERAAVSWAPVESEIPLTVELGRLFG